MVYNYRYFKKRGRYLSRKAYHNRYKIAKEAANYAQIARNVKYLLSVVNVEYKTHDTAISQSPNNSTGTVDNLCLIAQGDDNTDRNGRSVRLKSLQIKGTILSNTTSANVVRVLIVKTLNNQSAAPAVDDVLDSIDVNSLRQKDDNQRSYYI